MSHGGPFFHSIMYMRKTRKEKVHKVLFLLHLQDHHLQILPGGAVQKVERCDHRSAAGGIPLRSTGCQAARRALHVLRCTRPCQVVLDIQGPFSFLAESSGAQPHSPFFKLVARAARQSELAVFQPHRHGMGSQWGPLFLSYSFVRVCVSGCEGYDVTGVGQVHRGKEVADGTYLSVRLLLRILDHWAALRGGYVCVWLRAKAEFLPGEKIVDATGRQWRQGS